MRALFLAILLGFPQLMTAATDHLVSYWDLDSNLNDSASAGVVTDDGSFVSTNSYSSGVFGEAIQLNGTNYVTVPNGADNNGGNGESITVSVWFRTDGFDNDWATLVGHDNSGEWNMSREKNKSTMYWAGGSAGIKATAIDVTDGVWRHAVGVGAWGKPTRLYIDGVLQVTGTNSYLNPGSSRPFMIGNNPAQLSRSWTGEVDDVGIFDNELSALQVAAIYNLANDPEFSYPLDEVNLVFQSYDDGPGGFVVIRNGRWDHIAADPVDGRTFIELGTDGSGVAGQTAPEVITFTSDRVLIPEGFEIAFAWEVDSATTTVVIDQGVGDVTAQTTAGMGSFTFDPGPSSETTFTISATAPNGLAATKTLTIQTTDQPLLDSFTVSPQTVGPGDDVTVSWVILNANTVTLNGNPVASAGTQTLPVNELTSFVLDASNANGSLQETRFGVVSPPGEPVLTEFLASNIDGLLDEESDDGDWIQISNPTQLDVVIDGSYYLTDDPLDLTKWQIPAQTITPGNSIVIFASGKNLATHANFNLKTEGEYLALVKVDGANTILTEFNAYPRQFNNLSYGLAADFSTRLYYNNPTPDSENSGESFSDYVKDTSFSIDRGIYDSAQMVEITTLTPGAEIYYTTDGSEPSATSGTLYASPISVITTTTLRAIAVKDDFVSSNIDTHTYIFPGDVLSQNATPFGFPIGPVGGHVLDYEMSDALFAGTTGGQILDSLSNIPSLSIVTDQDNLFGLEGGIYINSEERGREWERPASMEMILPPGYNHPDGLLTGFQSDFGLRIRGGASRSLANPKHAFRAYFRKDYGQRALNFPLFGNEGTDEFKKIDLRTPQNYSWSLKKRQSGLNANEDNSYKNTFLREVLTRDLQADLDQPYTRSRYYNLYLNGLYWGVYMTQERPGDDFGDSYLGGDDEDFDTLKSSGNQDDYTTEVSDGNSTDWETTYNLAIDVSKDAASNNSSYFQLQGLNSSGARDTNLPIYLDVDNLIDYHLLIFYSGFFDGPLSAFNPIAASNNWFGVRNRTRGDRGWTFFIHDAEHSLGSWPSNTNDRTGPIWGGTVAQQESLERSNPQYIHQYLANNNEYKLRFADAVQREFFNSGALTNGSVLGRLATRKNTVADVINAEAARWGDTQDSNQSLKRTDWVNAVSNLEDWIDDRNLTVLAQLEADGLFPTTEAPIFSQHGGLISTGFFLNIANPNAGGSIYYTTDGSDPREIGGGINPTAIQASSFFINTSEIINTRIRISDSDWSALSSAEFLVATNPAPGDLIISEINYHPYDPTPGEITAGWTSDEDFEFIEITNTSASPVDLSKISIANEVNYSFSELEDLSERVIAAGGRIVIPRKPNAFAERYPGISTTGNYEGKLSNDTGTIELRGNGNTILFSVTYQDDAGWPSDADGMGNTLILRDPSAPNDQTSWRISTQTGGNPGTSDSDLFTGDATGDSNGNGITNLIEHTLRDATGTYLTPILGMMNFDNGSGPEDYHTLTYTYYHPVDNVTTKAEFSTDLTTWPDDQMELTSLTVNPDYTVTVTYRSISPISDNEKGFLRVKAIVN